MIVAAGIIPVLKTDQGYKFLLLRAYNFWNFPKGRAEEGESIKETAIRELEEESSIVPESLEFKWGFNRYVTEPFKRGKKVDTFFVAETNQKEIELKINPKIGKPEHHEYRWVNYEEGLKLVNERIAKAMQWANDKINGV